MDCLFTRDNSNYTQLIDMIMSKITLSCIVYALCHNKTNQIQSNQQQQKRTNQQMKFSSHFTVIFGNNAPAYKVNPPL